MKYLIYSLFLLASFGQLQRLTFASLGANIYIHEVLMLVVLFWTFVRYQDLFAYFKKRIRSSGLISSALIFLLVLLISWVNLIWKYDPEANLAAFLYFCKISLYISFFIALFFLSAKKGGKFRLYLKNGLLIFFVVTLITSLLQYFFYPNLRNLFYLGWDPHHFRVFGLFFDTSASSVIYALFVLWFADFLLHTNSKRSRRLIYLFLGFSVLLLILTYSRLGYAAFLTAFFYYLKKYMNVKKILSLAVLFLIILLFLPRPFGEGVKLERLFSVSARLEDQKNGFNVFVKNPLLGIGYNRIQVYKQSKNSLSPDHSASAYSSSFVTILAASGIAGLLAFLNFLKNIFFRAGRFGRSALMLVFTAALFDNVFFMSLVMLIFFSMLSFKEKLDKKTR